jgi:hypothetical protein
MEKIDVGVAPQSMHRQEPRSWNGPGRVRVELQARQVVGGEAGVRGTVRATIAIRFPLGTVGDFWV